MSILFLICNAFLVVSLFCTCTSYFVNHFFYIFYFHDPMCIEGLRTAELLLLNQKLRTLALIINAAPFVISF